MKNTKTIAEEIRRCGLEKTIWATPEEEIKDPDLRNLWVLAQMTLLKIYQYIERSEKSESQPGDQQVL